MVSRLETPMSRIARDMTIVRLSRLEKHMTSNIVDPEEDDG